MTGVNDGQTGSVPYTVNFAPAVSNDPTYNGLTPAPVSVINLPSELQNLQASNLAVTPSTGLNQGSTFTVAWNDANNGNIPAATPWDDQIEITNTTTGDTLASALVPYDPNQYGPALPGSSVPQSYVFTLPTTADGSGNIEVTVTANYSHTAYSTGTNLANANLQTYANGGYYPVAPDTLTVGGVDFALPARRRAANSFGVLQTNGAGTSFDIPVNIVGPAVGYTLINSTYGEAGDNVGSVEFKGTNGADAIFPLVEGTNIRDYNNDGYENASAAGTPSAEFGNGQVRLDMQTFVLPASFATATLTDIILTSTGGTPQGNPFMAAATVATASGPSQLVLLGSGTAPDVTNSQTVTVNSGSAVPGQVSIVLDPGSDSGVHGDDLTNVTTPTFDVTVNEAGTITVDFKSDGADIATQAVSAAGTYPFTSPPLADGTYKVTVHFTPPGEPTVSASVTITIDTKPPTLLTGASTQPGPVYSRTLTFSEAIDASTIGAAAILVSGPGITGSINPSAVIGSGAAYTVDFASPLITTGTYTLTLASTIADIAGNPLGSGVTDSFQLVPDTTPPTVESITPSGVVPTDISSLAVEFNEAIAASSFTSNQVTIAGPGGTIPTASITVTATSADAFTISFPAPTQDGIYNVTLGTGITDISGNPLATPYQSSFTIDTVPPVLDAVTPTGVVNTLITTIDLTFSKPINLSTLAGGVTLVGPDGPVSLGTPYLSSGMTYAIPVAALNVNGVYTLTVGPAVTDVIGRQMSQSQSFSFTVALPALVVDTLLPETGPATFGGNFLLTYTVHNEGAIAIPTIWTDDVFLSTKPTLDGTAEFLRSYPPDGESRPLLAPGAAQTVQLPLTIPYNGDQPSGAYYLIVETDAGGVVPEAANAVTIASVLIQVVDTTAPTETSFSPSGVTDQNVSSVQIGFSKPIAASSFTASQITITGQNGALDPSTFAITQVNAQEFQVSFPTQSAEGTYDVALGTGITDLSGNPLTAFLGSFTIDKTAPQISAVTPNGIVNTAVSAIHVTFSKAINPSTFTAADITLTDPNGNPISVSGPTLDGGTTYSFSFPTQNTEGTYNLTIAPGVQDVAGNPLAAAYQSSFTIELPALVLDTPVPGSSSGVFGEPFNLTYTVHNDGNGAVPVIWTDTVYLSKSPTIDNTAVPVDHYDGGGNRPLLAPGASPNDPVDIQPAVQFDADARQLLLDRSNRQWLGADRGGRGLDRRRDGADQSYLAFVA